MNHTAFRSWRASIAAAAGLLLLTSCGDGTQDPGGSLTAPRATRSVADDFGKLVPADATVLVHVNNLEAFENEVKEIVRAFNPSMEAVVSFENLYSMLDLRGSDLDTSGSGGMALKMGPLGPEPTVILPAANADAAKNLADVPMVASGSYVGMGMGAPATVAATASALGKDLPAGDLSLRVDLGRLLQPFLPQIEPFLDVDTLAQMNPSMGTDPGSKAMLGAMVQWARDFVKNAKNLEGSVSLDGGKLHMDLVIGVTPGSAVDPGTSTASGNVLELARALPDRTSSIVEVVSMDWNALYDILDPMFETMIADLPEEDRAGFRAYLENSKKMYGSFEPNMAVGMGLGADGLQVAALMRARDEAGLEEAWQTYMDEYMEIVSSGAMGTEGIEIVDGTELEVSGVTFKTYTMSFDFAAIMAAQGTPMPEEVAAGAQGFFDSMIGAGGMKLAMGIDGKNILTLMGDVEGLAAETLAKLEKGGGSLPVGMRGMVGKLHATPSLVVSVDLRRLLRSMSGFFPAGAPNPLAAVPAGEPIPMWFSCGTEGATYQLQCEIDLIGIAELTKAMRK